MRLFMDFIHLKGFIELCCLGATAETPMLVAYIGEIKERIIRQS